MVNTSSVELISRCHFSSTHAAHFQLYQLWSMHTVQPTTFRALALNLLNNVGAFVNIFTPYIGGYSTELFVERPWLFSLVWTVFYSIQFIATFFLTREPLGMRLQDRYYHTVKG